MSVESRSRYKSESTNKKAWCESTDPQDGGTGSARSGSIIYPCAGPMSCYFKLLTLEGQVHSGPAVTHCKSFQKRSYLK